MPEQRTDAGSASSLVRAQWAPPLQSDLRAELGRKGPQPLRGRKFTAGLGAARALPACLQGWRSGVVSPAEPFSQAGK